MNLLLNQKTHLRVMNFSSKAFAFPAWLFEHRTPKPTFACLPRISPVFPLFELKAPRMDTLLRTLRIAYIVADPPQAHRQEGAGHLLDKR
jgi:hypothetical protein